MKRRAAIKNLGWTMGITVSAPLALRLLQSCESGPNWTPVFFSLEEAAFISTLCDIMLPSSDTPGALDVHVPEFIDKYVAEVMTPDEQHLFGDTMRSFLEHCRSVDESLKKSAIEAVLKETLVKPKEALQKIEEELRAYKKAPDETSSSTILHYAFLKGLRDLCISAYKNAELVGEKVLAYAPIPGQQKGCISVSEATGGRAWSL